MALQLQSRPSSGAHFRKSSRPPKRNGPRLLAGIPLLLIEDDAANRKLMDVVLTESGAFVTATDSAEDAFVVLEYFTPRVIVLDLVLPDMAGLTFLEKLKSDPARRELTVIVVSALPGFDPERAAQRAGGAEYVRKPIDIESFPALVARTLALKTSGGLHGEE